MFEWLRREASRRDTSPRLYLTVDDAHLCWSAIPSQKGEACAPLARPILHQIESDGLATYQEHGYIASWDDVYAIVRHSEYSQVVAELNIPAIKAVAPSLESVGTLTDKDFGVSIAGWIDTSGASVIAKQVAGPILCIEGKNYLIPEASWRVVESVIAFWGRPESERNDMANRRAWGRIRQAAIASGAHLGDFLFRSVVLTPEKMLIDLNRVDIGGTNVVEVIPSFPGCPKGWLDQMDRCSDIPDRFDIPTSEGIVQVVVTSAVKSVLRQIKKMPGRRVAGSRAEAFITNPFAALGEDASTAIDADQFESARIDAGLVFERFTAHVERDPMGNPVIVGLLVETAGVSGHRSTSSSVELFNSDDELEQFIEMTDRRLKDGLQLSAWRDYEFELMGDSGHELEILREAMVARRKGFTQISYAQVYDLSAYSSRVEDIGVEKPFYSPYIAKKNQGEGWFPENLVPVIVWSSDEDSDPVAVPLTPELEQLLVQKLEMAEQAGESSLEVPSFPKPVPVSEAKALLQSFNAFRKEPPQEPATGIGAEFKTSERRGKTPTLVIGANIEGVDYEETRRELLGTYSATPVLPKALKSDVKLKDHQVTGIAWLQHLFSVSPNACRGAVLADDMGLGKTLQLLTLLAWAFETDATLPPALIVAPVSLLENWQEEAKRFFREGSLPIATIYGDALQSIRLPRSAIDAQLVQEGLVKFLRPGWVGSARIVLTTYETLRDLEFSFASERWSFMVCDEAQKIKNPNALVTRAAKKQNVRFKIACTGTPVENTLADLWCLFDFVQPGMLGALNEFGRRYRRPIEAKEIEDENKRKEAFQAVEELRARISAQILRRTKKDVAKDLPAKIVVDDCRKLPISSFQLSVYSQAVDLFRRRNEPGVRIPFKNHLGLLHYLRVVCTDPRGIGAEASVIESLTEYRKRSPKLDWLLKQLHDIRQMNGGQGEKAIVFCEFRGVQRLLRHYIEQAFGFAPDVINGDTAASSSHQQSRQKRIRAFQDKPGFGVIILSPIAVGFGVNIQAANHVIHYTRTWNPAKEDQATDRAYRIGQTKDVFVYYPVVTASDFMTFDVKLDQLLEYKRELAQDMLNGSGDIRPGEFNIDDVVPGGSNSTVDPCVTPDDLLTMSPRYVEGLAAALWQAEGFPIVYRTPDSGDDGVDVVALSDSRGVLIQCKSSTDISREITWDAVKDVVTGEASYRRRHPGVEFELLCLTNQRFNAKAKEQAALNHVTLVDQARITELLNHHSVTFSQIESFIFASWADAVSEASI